MANRHENHDADQAELMKKMARSKLSAPTIKGDSVSGGATSVARDNSGRALPYIAGAGGSGGISSVTSTGGIMKPTQPPQQHAATPSHGQKRVLRLTAQKLSQAPPQLLVCDLCSAVVFDMDQHARYHETIMHASSRADIFEPFLVDAVIQEEPDERDLEGP